MTDALSNVSLATGDDPYDLFAPGAWDDPYPIYERLRREAPLHRGMLGSLVASRHSDVKWLLRGAPTEAAPPISPFLPPLPDEPARQLRTVGESLERWLTFMEEPRHQPLRRFMQPGFRRPDLERLRGRVRTICDELLGSAEEAGRMEAIGDFAYPLPALVIAELMGFPREEFPRFRRWSRVMVRFFDDHQHQDAASIAEMHALHQEARELVGTLIEERRRHPQDDFLGRFAKGLEAGEIDGEEILANVLNLLFAGHETTMNLLGTGLMLLFRHPEQAATLRRHPEGIPMAVEEMLRYESPAPYIGRLATEDFELHGQTLRRGEPIILLLGAANRDPEVFHQPDDLDLRRHPNPHLAFGFGHHTCLGAPLARFEAQIAFAVLLERLDRMEPETDRPPWRSANFLRGLAELPVRFGH